MTSDKTLELSGCVVDLRRQRVIRDGEEQRLSTRELELLVYLAERPGTVVSREQIYVDVWEYSPRTRSRALDQAVRQLRMKIGDSRHQPTHIFSVYGQGYRFEPLAAPASSSSPPPALVLTNLGAADTAFFGRRDDLDKIDALFDEERRLVVILGPGGMGKTRLS